MRGEVLKIDQAFPNWSRLTVKGQEKELLLCDNWNGARKEIGLKPLEVGDVLEFDISEKGVYSNEGPYMVNTRHIEA